MSLFGVHARIADEIRSLLGDSSALDEAGAQAKLHDLLQQFARDFAGRELHPEEFEFVVRGGAGAFETLLHRLEQLRLRRLEGHYQQEAPGPIIPD